MRYVVNQGLGEGGNDDHLNHYFRSYSSDSSRLCSSADCFAKLRGHACWLDFRWEKGTLSILLFLVIGLFLPVFSGSRTTVPVLMGPSAGYVLAWLFVPLVFAFLYRRWLARYRSLAFLAIFISGVLLVDLLGTIWLAVYTDMPLTRSLVASLVFIPGDTIKAVIATALAVSYKDSFLNTNS